MDVQWSQRVVNRADHHHLRPLKRYDGLVCVSRTRRSEAILKRLRFAQHAETVPAVVGKNIRVIDRRYENKYS